MLSCAKCGKILKDSSHRLTVRRKDVDKYSIQRTNAICKNCQIEMEKAEREAKKAEKRRLRPLFYETVEKIRQSYCVSDNSGRLAYRFFCEKHPELSEYLYKYFYKGVDPFEDNE
ncbi:hypothetical protein AUJ66_00800 [Candidatus Desantisbacteria bacterium CG1_02_38_46]|uniref:Uncharacterized protein n=1 Tax=Candidatus Desantisbacteria bacterium CG1_02_38_46 TaxID=1817893 RepID=A0A1J4SGV0_9BACT|nr:MAG: hypothetical protein AUJ66_00800 [Candidatus Desantisbacteria bacterium CG1_02_38_46]